MSGAKASTEQLSAMIAKMKANGGVRARFELHEELTVRSDRLTEGETLRIHLPMPIGRRTGEARRTAFRVAPRRVPCAGRRAAAHDLF